MDNKTSMHLREFLERRQFSFKISPVQFLLTKKGGTLALLFFYFFTTGETNYEKFVGVVFALLGFYLYVRAIAPNTYTYSSSESNIVSLNRFLAKARKYACKNF